jgi:hypothetical protein
MIEICELPARHLPNLTSLFFKLSIYDKHAFQSLIQQPSSYYDRDSREYEFPLNKLFYLIDLLIKIDDVKFIPCNQEQKTTKHVENNFKLKENSKFKNKTITFHKPCHMSKADFEKVENFLSSIDGINYKRLDNIESCCGFGGSYFIYHPIIAIKIALKKAFDIKKTKTDLILTACPSCTMGLRFNQLISFNFKKTLELRDFIDKELTK